MGRLGLVLLGLLVSGVFVAGILVLLDNDSEEPESPGAQSGAGTGLLLSSTRENLAICIELVGEASLSADASELRVLSTEAVTEAMADIVKHPVWLRTTSLSGAVEVVVDADCPGEANVQCDDGPDFIPLFCDGVLVTEPSPYRLFVFVVSEADLQGATGGLTRGLTSLEHVCWGDSCIGVTTATWVSKTEIADRDETYALVAEALGLVEARGD